MMYLSLALNCCHSLHGTVLLVFRTLAAASTCESVNGNYPR